VADVKRLLVVGNGLDLASGLDSKFSSFLSKKSTSDLNELVSKISKVRMLKNTSLQYRFGPELHTDDSSTMWEESIQSFQTLNEKGARFNFWIFWFLLQKKLTPDENQWSDVETELSVFLSSKAKGSMLSKISDGLDNYRKIRKDDALGSEDSVRTIRRLRAMDFEHLICAMLILVYNYSIYNYGKEKLLDFFLNELNDFEGEFQKYLRQEVKSSVSYEEKVEHLIEKISGGDLYNLLSFNYTTPDKGAIQSVNIHGQLDGKIIIGIDSTSVDASKQPELYKFTKTYRIMSEANQRRNMVLTRTIKTIAFFGHSLARADYAYFQSLFDYFDIYKENITLIFFFSVFRKEGEGEDEAITNRQQEQFEAVSQLIEDYGKTLESGKGKNLLHKMLLEGRVVIRDVDSK